MGRFRLHLTPLATELQTPTPPGGTLTTLSGNYETIFKGSGLEFRDFRLYAPTDAAKRIDWKASLKTSKLVVREYQEERNAEVLFCFDTSAGMVFGTKKLKCHYGAEFVSSLGKHIIDANDAVGLVTFNKEATNFIYPAIGEQQLHLLMDTLSSFSTYGGRPGFRKVLELLENNVLEGTTVIMVSDFFRFKRNKRYERKLRILRGKFELIFVILRDPVEEFLQPKQKQVVLLDPKTQREILITPSKIKKRYIIETKKEKEKLKEYFKKLNIPVLELYSDRPFVEPLYEFFVRWGYNR